MAVARKVTDAKTLAESDGQVQTAARTMGTLLLATDGDGPLLVISCTRGPALWSTSAAPLDD